MIVVAAIGGAAFAHAHSLVDGATIALLLVAVRGVDRIQRHIEILHVHLFSALAIDITEIREALMIPDRDAGGAANVRIGAGKAREAAEGPRVGDTVGEIVTVEAIVGFAWVAYHAGS